MDQDETQIPGRPRFYWETGPFGPGDLDQVKYDIDTGMSEEEIRLAVLSINKTSTQAIGERKKGSPQAKAKKTKEKALLQAARDHLAQQGIDEGDVMKAYLRSSANSTPQQELAKIQAASRTPAPLTYCPVCDLDITGTCPLCGYNGE